MNDRRRERLRSYIAMLPRLKSGRGCGFGCGEYQPGGDMFASFPRTSGKKEKFSRAEIFEMNNIRSRDFEKSNKKTYTHERVYVCMRVKKKKFTVFCHTMSRTFLLRITPSKSFTSRTAVAPVRRSAAITGKKSIVPSPAGLCVSFLPLLS